MDFSVKLVCDGAVLAGLLLFVTKRRGRSQGRAKGKGSQQGAEIAAVVPEGKGRPGNAQNRAGLMDTAKIQSTGGAESPMRPGRALSLLLLLLLLLLTF